MDILYFIKSLKYKSTTFNNILNLLITLFPFSLWYSGVPRFFCAKGLK